MELNIGVKAWLFHPTVLCMQLLYYALTHWGRVTHICVSKLTIIGSVNGLSPGRRQVIIGNNAGILLIRHLRTNVSEILIEILTSSLKKMHLKSRLRNGGHFVQGGWVKLNAGLTE